MESEFVTIKTNVTKNINIPVLESFKMAASRLTFWAILIICIFDVSLGEQTVVEMNENNWGEMLKGEWMVEFFAPWCPACKGLQPVWKDFAYWAASAQVQVAQVDVTHSPGLSGRFMVTALPTIFHVLNGEFRQYKGTRDKASFLTFIREKKWQGVEPVSAWKSPNSIQMSIVSWFFQLSQVLRGVHSQLMEDFGLPTWGSYLIFAIATIILGALLGLVLVCIIDFVYPPKPSATFKSGKEEKEKLSDDELADEDIKDDLYDDATSNTADAKDTDKSDSDSKLSFAATHKRKSRKAD